MACKVEERLSRNINSTSESMFGFTSQPEAQCPVVDDVVRILKEQSKEVKNTIEELRGIDEVRGCLISDLENVEYELRTLNIEDLRTAIIQLR